MSAERVAAFSQMRTLQEPVDVDVGQQWTCDAALRRAARVSLAATHAPGLLRVPFFDRRFQRHLDEAQDVSIHQHAGLLNCSSARECGIVSKYLDKSTTLHHHQHSAGINAGALP